MKEKKERQQKFKSPAALVIYFLRGSLGFFILSMVFAAAVSFLDMVLPGMISFTVDSVIGNKAPDLPESLLACLDAAGGAALFREKPFLIAAAVIAVALTGACFRFLFRYFNDSNGTGQTARETSYSAARRMWRRSKYSYPNSSPLS